MKILITGGAGYVGRAVCQRLAENHEITVFDVQPPAANYPYIVGSILNSADLLYAMRTQDAVVHLAARPTPRRWSDDDVMQVNVMGTQRVVEAAACGDPRRVVMASSDATFGFVFSPGRILPQYLPVDEDHPTCPTDAYGLSKVIGEQICARYSRDVGLKTVCLRYCWVWNPQHYVDIALYQDQSEDLTRALWSYVDGRDIAQAVELALTAEDLQHEVLLITSGETFCAIPTLELIRRYLPSDCEIREPDYFASNPHITPFDTRRAYQVLGYQPQFLWREQCGD